MPVLALLCEGTGHAFSGFLCKVRVRARPERRKNGAAFFPGGTCGCRHGGDRAGLRKNKSFFTAPGGRESRLATIRNGRPASSHRPALTLARCSVAAHCALLRVLATPALRASDARRARLWHSLLHWGLRTGLRFAGPVFWGCGALRAVLAPSPLRGFDGYGLFRAQRANRFHAFKYFINSLLNCARRYLLMGRRSPFFNSNSQYRT